MDSGGALALFLKKLGEKTFDSPALGAFLDASAELPLDLPLLQEIREFRASLGVAPAGRGGADGAGAKLERRYLRLCFVQESLERIDFKKVKPGQGFEDFMLGQTDFSCYASLDEKPFNAFFMDGLGDYPDSFFASAFGMGREALRALMLASYAEGEGRRELVKNRLFILPVMRTLHSSLDFAPLWDKEAVLAEIGGVLEFFAGRRIIDARPALVHKEKSAEVFLCLLSLFNHAEYRQEDGAKTGLFLAPFRGALCLAGAFRPQGKTHSLSLASSGLPPEALPGARGLKDFTALGGLCIRGRDGGLTLSRAAGS